MLRIGSLTLSFTLITGILTAIKGDSSEVTIGQLAITKGASDPVKAFGQTLIDDHSKAKAEASAVAAKTRRFSAGGNVKRGSTRVMGPFETYAARFL